MLLLKPNYTFNSILDIDRVFLKSEDIKLIIFDADATLIQAKSHMISEKFLAKIDELSLCGFKLFIASNGKTNRINSVFKGHNIISYGMSFKPFPFRLKKLIKDYRKEEVLLVGDQLFTDILCGKFLRIKVAMVKPYGEDIGFGMKLKRKLEQKILKN